MRYYEAPIEYEEDAPAIFLAGGISDAEDWQQRLVRMLPKGDFAVLNPRRAKFPMGDPAAAAEQIEWEHRHLQRASVVVFWFPPQTLCPIALFELGACCAEKSIVVGVDPGYARRADIEHQLRLRRPDVQVVYELEELAVRARSILSGDNYEGTLAD
jgi:hypothetical protein